MIEIISKKCSKCGEWKIITEFYRDNRLLNGHRASCKDCEKLYIVTYRALHKEKLTKSKKEYRASHLEQGNERLRKYRATHSEQVKKHDREYYATHREQKAQRERAKRAWKKGVGGNGITAEQWERLKKDYCYLCAYCGQKKPLEMDHVIPLHRGGKHDISNVIPACKSCNSRKGIFTLLVFLYRQKR